jgi:hypothetical protein
MKVLVVDDERDVQTLFEQRFRKEMKSGEWNLPLPSPAKKLCNT